MKLFQITLLLLVQLSPIFVHGNSEALTIYKCAEIQSSEVNVRGAIVMLTKGCVLNGHDIKFHLKAMYDDTRKISKAPGVVIDITEAAFFDSNIKIINNEEIPDLSTQVPLLFTMRKSNMSGTSRFEFGTSGKVFKLPPNSHISIVDSQLTISLIRDFEFQIYIFTFHGLQLVTNCSMEVARNVITTDCIGSYCMSIFYISLGTGIMISGGSSFSLMDNNITLKGTTGSVFQNVWFQGSNSPLTIYNSSSYKWAGNIISMTGNSAVLLYQFLWYRGRKSPLTVSDSSTYTWASNIISMVGYSVTSEQEQYVWYQGSDSSPLSISQNSTFTWVMNSIRMDLYKLTNNILVKTLQYLWYISSPITISVSSQFLFEANKILMLAKDYTTIESYLMRIEDSIIITKTIGTISGSSSMIWKDNCIGMGHKETDKRHVFGGRWSITGEGSELLLDGTNITTTDKYMDSGKLTELVWGVIGDTDIAISNTGELTIGNTNVYSNSAGSATGSMVWSSSPFTSKKSVKQPNMQWSSSAAIGSNGSSIPTLVNSNLIQYMCDEHNPTLAAIIPGPTPKTVKPAVPATPSPGEADDITTTEKGKSNTSILSTIHVLLITSVVFLFLYNW